MVQAGPAVENLARRGLVRSTPVLTVAGATNRMSRLSATPAALMFLVGLALVYWGLSGLGLYGLKKEE